MKQWKTIGKTKMTNNCIECTKSYINGWFGKLKCSIHTEDEMKKDKCKDFKIVHGKISQEC